MKVDVALRTSASIAIRHFDAYFNMAPTSADVNTVVLPTSRVAAVASAAKPDQLAVCSQGGQER